MAKRTLESGKVVAGGGAVDVACSIHLDHFSRTYNTKEQIAITEFSEALNIIPKTLAVNAAKDATELVAKLRAYHHTSQTKEGKAHLAHYGLDLYNGAIINNVEKGILEPATSKIKSLQFATEAAITILRIDDLIQLYPSQEEQ